MFTKKENLGAKPPHKKFITKDRGGIFYMLFLSLYVTYFNKFPFFLKLFLKSIFWIVFASAKCFRVAIKAGTHLRQGNTKMRPYKAASARLVWTAHVYHASNTNRNTPCLLPRFTNNWWIGPRNTRGKLPVASELPTLLEQRLPHTTCVTLFQMCILLYMRRGADLNNALEVT